MNEFILKAMRYVYKSSEFTLAEMIANSEAAAKVTSTESVIYKAVHAVCVEKPVCIVGQFWLLEYFEISGDNFYEYLNEVKRLESELESKLVRIHVSMGMVSSRSIYTGLTLKGWEALSEADQESYISEAVWDSVYTEILEE